MSTSKVIHADNYHWESVERKQYKTDTDNFKDIHRYSLLGEAEDEQALNMQTRYFEIQPGGYSSLEYHRHPHSVIVIRGSGSLVLDNELRSLSLHDIIFIAPNTIHQFHADNNEHLGFICVVDRYRDRPSIPTESDIANQITNQKILDKIRY